MTSVDQCIVTVTLHVSYGAVRLADTSVSSRVTESSTVTLPPHPCSNTPTTQYVNRARDLCALCDLTPAMERVKHVRGEYFGRIGRVQAGRRDHQRVQVGRQMAADLQDTACGACRQCDIRMTVSPHRDVRDVVITRRR